MTNSQAVILIHGLFGTTPMTAMGEDLKNNGFKPHYFDYKTNFLKPPYFKDLSELAEKLLSFIDHLDTEESKLSFVCHSMGGLILLKALELRPNLKINRVVFHGTPFEGSPIADYLHHPDQMDLKGFKPNKKFIEGLKYINHWFVGSVGEELSVIYRKANPLKISDQINAAAIVTGDRAGLKYAWSKPLMDFIGTGKNDGLVPFSSACAGIVDQNTPILSLPTNHDGTLRRWIIGKNPGIAQTRHFLNHNCFDL
tara:strand:- start:1211 stop:1972 length:762 start_codon:yes stop_codon:yes gene_type:complete